MEGRKRRRLDPAEICQQLYETLRTHRKADGTLLCDTFIRAPKRRQEPSYYDVVSSPIDLLRVQQKLRTDEYIDVDQFTADIELLVNNAKAFYQKTSAEYRDASELWDFYIQTRDRLLDNRSPEETEPKLKIILKMGKLARKAAAAEARKQEDEPEDEEGEESRDTSISSASALEDSSTELALEELFSTVMTAVDADDRPLHTAFQLLPSKKDYPDYYRIIDNPIDLKTIAMKIQASEYTNLNELERDLLIMTKNAVTFNEPGSQIYKDAKALKKVITARRAEIEHSVRVAAQAGKTSERIRQKRLKSGQCMSAITAALQYDDDELAITPAAVKKEKRDSAHKERSADDEESADEAEEADTPQWQLYQALKRYPDPSVVEPFIRLPSRRYYSDYFREIKNPISLTQISKKIQIGEYGTLSELASDLNLMFQNAKHYNRPDSKIYKDAVRLQKYMQSKMSELLEDESLSEDDGEERAAKRKKGRPRLSISTGKVARRSGAGSGSEAGDLPLKKRLKTLYRCLTDLTVNGTQPILAFMEKPSRKTYPDYYKVIAEPMDMLTIEANIKLDKYASEEDMLDDVRLMFNNCRQYNEEGSAIYEDANTLEKAVMDKAKEMGVIFTSNSAADKKLKRRSRNQTIPVVNIQAKLKTLYDAIKDYRDNKGRQVAHIFMKLPSKSEYPDYYEVIKHPIDMEKIGQKLKSGAYETLEDMLSDLVLMFDNGCKFNEPDSQIYKDALTLQRLALQTKASLSEDEERIPDVKAAVQELLTSLFIAVYNHQDEESRCYSDSLAELPEHDEVNGVKVRGLSLDLIKRRLDKGLYKRLDAFQDDMFQCFDRARRLSRTDSQAFEDATELQCHFIRQRDDLCQKGELLSSPALAFNADDLAATVESLRQEKAAQEQADEDVNTTDAEMEVDGSENEVKASGNLNTISFNQQTYCVGDFVYVEAKERNLEPHIYCIEKLYTDPSGEQMFLGNWFCRPNETYHLASRKFLEKEVFKSDVRTPTPLSKVLGQCYVLYVREYLISKPEGFPDRDVYLCESRYSTRQRIFKKIKLWSNTIPDTVKLIPRETPIEPKRIVSVFRERIEKHKEELAELDEEKGVERVKPNALAAPVENSTSDGRTYYEQLTIPVGTLRTGDCVYVRAENGKQLMAQIDSMWTNAEGVAYFHGPWFVTPTEIAHAPTRLFYRQEVFLSSIEDTNPLLAVVGKCAVLEHQDYIACKELSRSYHVIAAKLYDASRPTEIAENDVYICESLYEESRRQIKKLSREGLKQYVHGPAVYRDEVYYFRRPIHPQKESSPLLPKMSGNMAVPDVDVLLEDSLDEAPPSVGSDTAPVTPIAVTSAKKVNKPPTKKVVTGYIVYSSEVRKGVAANHPEASFGEVSRIVGNEWRNLPAHEKQVYEERAARMNEESAAEARAMSAETGVASPAPATPAAAPAQPPHPDTVYDCLWQKCEQQFEDINDLTDHLLNEQQGHLQTQNFAPNETEFQCQWRGCSRIRKGVQPFPKHERLLRHVREIHIQKQQGRIVAQQDRGKNFVARKHPKPIAPGTPVATNAASNANAGAAGSATTTVTVVGKPQGEPLFVAVPPGPQRLLHSEAYIKYIEGLHSQSRYISHWDKYTNHTANGTETPAVPDVGRLPTQWVSHLELPPAARPNAPSDIVNALWLLRDHMLKDVLTLAKR